jgi:hypothetical protein
MLAYKFLHHLSLQTLHLHSSTRYLNSSKLSNIKLLRVVKASRSKLPTKLPPRPQLGDPIQERDDDEVFVA